MKKTLKLLVAVSALFCIVFTGCSNPVNVPSNRISNEMLKPVSYTAYIYSSISTNTNATMTLTPCNYGIRIKVEADDPSLFSYDGVYIEDQFGNQIEFRDLYNGFENRKSSLYRDSIGKIDFVYPYVTTGKKYEFNFCVDWMPKITLSTINYASVLEKNDDSGFLLSDYNIQSASKNNFTPNSVNVYIQNPNGVQAIPKSGINNDIVTWNIIFLFNNDPNVNYEWTDAVCFKHSRLDTFSLNFNWGNSGWSFGKIDNVNAYANISSGSNSYNYLSREIDVGFIPKGLPATVNIGGEDVHLGDVKYVKTVKSTNIPITVIY